MRPTFIALVLTAGVAAQAAPPKASVRLDRALVELERSPSDSQTLRRVLDLSHAAGGLEQLVKRYQDRALAKPSLPIPRLILGHLRRASGDCASATESYRAAAERDLKMAAPHLGIAECAMVAERWSDAAAAFRVAADRERNTQRKIDVLEQLVRAALQAEQDAVAQAAFIQLVAVSPQKQLVRIHHAQALERSGRLKLALEVWTDVHHRARSDEQTRLLSVKSIGSLAARLGDHKRAIAIYRDTLKRLSAEHWAVVEVQEGLIGVYRQLGRLKEYIKELEKKRSSYPVLLLLARLYEEVGDDVRAMAAYRKAVKQRPANVDARRALLRLLQRSGDTQELEGEYKRLTKQVPGEPRYEMELATLYLKQGKKDEGLALLDRLSRKYNQDPGIHEAVLDLFVRYQAERPRIEREMKALIRLEPDQEGHLVQLGEYYFGQGDRGAAVTTWDRVLRVVPRKAKGHIILARLYAEHEMQGEAIEHFRQATRLASTRADYHKGFALYLERVARYADARTLWAKVIELVGPTDHAELREARQHIVGILDKQATLPLKMRAWRLAFEAEPPDWGAGLFLAEALITMKELEPAAKVLERLTELRPQDAEGLLYLEEVYEKLYRLSDSIALLERIAELDPGGARERLRRMAQLSIDLHKPDDALKYARLVVNLNPTAPEAHLHLGDIYVQMERWPEALAAYRQGLRLAPANVRAQFKLAHVLEELDRKKELATLLIEVVDNASDPTDVLAAGRQLMTATNMAAMERLEPVLLAAVFRRAHKPIYRKLLVDLYAVMVERHSRRLLDPAQAADARQKLAGIGERGLKPVLDSIDASDLAVRTRVLRILMATRSHNAVLPLVRLLEEKDSVLRFQALVALAHIGSTSAVAPIEKLIGARQRVGPGAVWALGAIGGEEAIAKLSALVRPPHRRMDLPVLAALGLGLQGRPEGVEPLLSLLSQGQKVTQMYAAWALGAIGDVRAVEPLLRRLPVAEQSARHLIVWALGAIGSDKAMEPLLEILWSRDSELTSVARWAVGRILAPQPLDRQRMREIYLALADFERANVGSQHAIPALAPMPVQPLDGAKLLNDHGDRIRAVLLRRLETGGEQVQRRLVELLLSTNLTPVLAPLLPHTVLPTAWRPEVARVVGRLATSGPPRVRAPMLRLLGALDVDSARPVLTTALRDVSPPVSLEAALALGRSGDGAAIEPLLAALDDAALGHRWTGRLAACQALLQLLTGDRAAGMKAVPALTSLLTDAYPSVREAAANALVPLGTDAATAQNQVTRLLSDEDPDVVIAAISALGAMGVTSPLQKLLQHPDPRIRAAAAAAVTPRP